jgi:hypothetical protein
MNLPCKNTEHDSNQLGICSMLIAATVKTVGHTWINSKTNWLRSIIHRLIQNASVTETNQDRTVVITDKFYRSLLKQLNDDNQISIFFSKLQYAKINKKQREIARNLNWW